MKKKTRRHIVHHHKPVASKKQGNYFVAVRGWMFVVMFALMLGIGAIVGNFINAQLEQAGSVAGVSTQVSK